MSPQPYRSSILFVSCAFALSAACVAPGDALAQSAPNHPGYAFGKPGGEALLALGAGLANLASALPQRDTGWMPDAPHPYSRTADRLSDVTGAYGGAAIGLLAGFGLETAYFGESGVRGGWVYAERTALVELESLFFTRGLVDTLKRLTGRCRPQYALGNGQCSPSVKDAFPSGHTAPMGALAATRLTFAFQSTGPSGYRWGSFALAETMAIVTAFLRVRAGKHSWSDVIAGFLLGHATGALIALLHPMEPVPPGDLTFAESTGQGGFGLLRR